MLRDDETETEIRINLTFVETVHTKLDPCWKKEL